MTTTTRQERLYVALLHEVNARLGTNEISLHQLQRGLEAMVYRHCGKARYILGEQAESALQQVLSTYDDEGRN